MKKIAIAVSVVALGSLAMAVPAVGGVVNTTTYGVTEEQGDNSSPSVRPSVSGNGKFVVFSSSAQLKSADTNSVSDIYLYDRTTDVLKLVTKGRNGGAANDDSDAPVISKDGKRIAFESDASNLVAKDTNDSSDVFVVATSGGPFSRISVSSSEKQGNDHSYSAGITATGKAVVFESYASNLVTADANEFGDIFVRNLATAKTRRVSVKKDGTEGNGDSYDPAIDPKGLFVSFTSDADNFVGNDENGCSDVFTAHNLKVARASLTNTPELTESNSCAYDPSHSAGCILVGTKSVCTATVVFTSDSDNLVSNDTNLTEDVFMRSAGVTTRISLDTDENQSGLFEASGSPSISANGRYVAFVSDAPWNGSTNATGDVYLRDRQAGTTTLVSWGQNGAGNGDSFEPAISADGKWVTFESMAYNLYSVPRSSNLTVDIFLRGPLF